MFLEHFGIVENPFSNTPDPNFVYMSRRHEEALAHLSYGVKEASGFVLLTGEVGIGKTTISRCLAERLPGDIDLALCVNPRLDENELLAYICDEMGIEVEGSRYSAKDLMDSINKHLLEVHASGRRAVLIIDEAQNLPPQLLELVRLLTNLETAKRKLLQIILIGQPELRDILARDDLRQLSQRITARYHLEPMDLEQMRQYLGHRLSIVGLPINLFHERAIREIYSLSRGVPRLVNSICERAMLGAYAQGQRGIDRQLVDLAASEVLGRPEIADEAGVVAWKWAALVLVLALGVAILYLRDPFEWRQTTYGPGAVFAIEAPAGPVEPRIGG